jgi:hypothetical protein
MIDDRDILSENGGTGDPRERRREPRIEFAQACTLSVSAPVWAMTNRSLAGRTEDITLHGLRVNFDEVDPKRAASWADAVLEDTELKVEIVLTGVPESPVLKGQIVWVHLEENVEDGKHPCAVGVLFSVMREKDQQALKRLIGSVG